jgi:hypothetical protein
MGFAGFESVPIEAHALIEAENSAKHCLEFQTRQGQK